MILFYKDCIIRMTTVFIIMHIEVETKNYNDTEHSPLKNYGIDPFVFFFCKIKIVQHFEILQYLFRL